MSAQMCDAVSDLISTGQLMPPTLYERFLGWARNGTFNPDGTPGDNLDHSLRAAAA